MSYCATPAVYGIPTLNRLLSESIAPVIENLVPAATLLSCGSETVICLTNRLDPSDLAVKLEFRLEEILIQSPGWAERNAVSVSSSWIVYWICPVAASWLLIRTELPSPVAL